MFGLYGGDEVACVLEQTTRHLGRVTHNVELDIVEVVRVGMSENSIV